MEKIDIQLLSVCHLESCAKFIVKLCSESDFFIFSSSDFACDFESFCSWRGRLKENLESKQSFVLLAICGGKVVGILWSWTAESLKVAHRAELSMGVLRDFYGRGIGKALLGAAEQVALERGICRFELSVMETNLPALCLYCKCGYRIEGFKHSAVKTQSGFVGGYWMAKLLKAKSATRLKLDPSPKQPSPDN